MGKIKFLIFSMLFIITSSAYTNNISKIDSIVIKQDRWDLTYPAAVNCHDFENGNSYMEYRISDSIIISNIMKELGCLKKSSGNSLDVRCKMYFYSSGKICTSACIDAAHVLYNGELYLLSRSLKKTIDRLTTKSKRGKRISMKIPKDRDIPFPCGRDSLNRYLLSQSEDLYKFIDNPIALVVICQIDSQGKTLNVIIKNKDSASSNDGTKMLFKRLSDIFMNDIKWIPNKERFPFETVSIPLRFL